MTASTTIAVEDLAGVRIITLNRPDKLNSFNEEMHGALREALTGAGNDGVRAVLLTGAGKGFCAGQDLSDRVQGEGGKAPDLGQTVDTFWNPLVRAVRGLAKPVVCAVADVGPGRATLTMTITETMTNGHGMCHGGFIFTLADSTLAFACNAYNQRAVAQHCDVTFLRPARLGDRLTAECVERARAGRSGI